MDTMHWYRQSSKSF